MEFWGIELKPGKSHCFRLHNDEHRKLIVTTATLGEGLGKAKSVIQCSIGDNKSPVVCELLPNENESCSLRLVFEDDDDSVEFLVIGDRSIYLTGYLQTCVQEKGKGVNRGVVMEEKEDAKSFERFLKNSIFRSKNLSDRRLGRKLRNPPLGSSLSGNLYKDILPPSEELLRLWRTLPRQQFRETVINYLRHKSIVNGVSYH